MKKLSGFDLNGWRDSAARNWIIQPDGDEAEVPSSFVEGGLNGVVVQTGATASAAFVGGAQASLAPHGLGDGWGAIGAGGKRIRVRDLITGSGPIEHLAAAFRGMVPNADFGVACLDDHPGTTELLQERLLEALRKARTRTPLLVWRPVLAALHAIEHGFIGQGQTVGVVCHVAEGFTLQRLRIRRERSRGQTVLAPERRAVGKLLASDLGYAGLALRAKRAIEAASCGDRRDHLAWARAHGLLTLGLPAKPEVLRLRNGDWEILTPPSELAVSDLPDAPPMGMEFEGCDAVLFESLSDGKIADDLFSKVNDALSAEATHLPVSAVAEGALLAARRMSRREPVYFDFLPQISTIVQRREAAENFDLIDHDATLPAGEVYRSPAPARLAIQAGQDRFSIFLKKETSSLPRKAEVSIGTTLSEATPVDLWVEQSPASGRAKILVHSHQLGNQFQVDWDGATELQTNWEDLLDGFKRTKPTIPGRLILPCGMDSWNDNPRGDGLLTLIEKSVGRPNVDWTALANRLAARPGGKYAVSSDGEIPSEVDPTAEANLGALIDRAVADVRDKLRKRAEGTDSIRFLTWLFKRCPADVAVLLLEAWDQETRASHPIFRLGAQWKLAYQGLGRIANTQNHELHAMQKMLSRTVDTWKWQKETAAMAFLLSRSETAPCLLSRSEVDRVAKRVLWEFKENLGTTYTKFQYAPLLLVGLLRWRLREPFALVAGQDPVADTLVNAVEATLADLAVPSRARAFAKFGRILEQTLEELRGEGSNPELLLDIFGGASDDGGP